MNNKYSVWIIIVSYNGKSDLNICIQSILKSSYPNTIVVVDNNSEDGTPEFIKINYPQITIIQSGNNLGFGKANNLGIEYAYQNKADFFFLLNQDTYIFSDTINNLIDSFEKTKKGFLSPIHLNSTQKDFDNNFNYFVSSQSKEFVSDSFFSRLKTNYDIPFINAAAWFISRETIELVGGFDPIFPHYGEDNDYCNRNAFYKKSVSLVTNSFIVHTRDLVNPKPGTVKKIIKTIYINTLINLKNLEKPFSVLFIRYIGDTIKELFVTLFQFKLKTFLLYVLVGLKIISKIPAIVKARENSKKSMSFLFNNNI